MSISIGGPVLIGPNALVKAAMGASAYSADRLDAAFRDAVKAGDSLQDLKEIAAIVSTKESKVKGQARLAKLALEYCGLKNTIALDALLEHADGGTLLATFAETCALKWFARTFEILENMGAVTTSDAQKLFATNAAAKDGIDAFGPLLMKGRQTMKVKTFELAATLVSETARRAICVTMSRNSFCDQYLSEAFLKGLTAETRAAMAENMCNFQAILAMHGKGMDFKDTKSARYDVMADGVLKMFSSAPRPAQGDLTNSQVESILMLTERAPPLSDRAVAVLVVVALQLEIRSAASVKGGDKAYTTLTRIFSAQVPRANIGDVKDIALAVSTVAHASPFSSVNVYDVVAKHLGKTHFVKNAMAKEVIYKYAMTTATTWSGACAFTLKLDTSAPIAPDAIKECFSIVVSKKTVKDKSMSPFIADLIDRGFTLADGDLQKCVPFVTLDVIERLMVAHKPLDADRAEALKLVVAGALVGEDRAKGVELFFRLGAKANANNWAALNALKYSDKINDIRTLRAFLSAADAFFESEVDGDGRRLKVAAFGKALNNTFISFKAKEDIKAAVLGEVSKHPKIIVHGIDVDCQNSFKK